MRDCDGRERLRTDAVGRRPRSSRNTAYSGQKTERAPRLDLDRRGLLTCRRFPQAHGDGPDGKRPKPRAGKVASRKPRHYGPRRRTQRRQRLVPSSVARRRSCHLRDRRLKRWSTSRRAHGRRCSGTRIPRPPRASGASAGAFPERARAARPRAGLPRSLRARAATPAARSEDRRGAADRRHGRAQQRRRRPGRGARRSVVREDARAGPGATTCWRPSRPGAAPPRRRSRTWPGQSPSARKPAPRPATTPTSSRFAHTTTSGA